jgi:putative ABC transport system ATP-binding protein
VTQAVTQGAALQVNHLRFGFSGQPHDLLTVPTLQLAAGQSLGLRGVSGAGKTTLFHCLAGITAPNAGQIIWGSTDICGLKPEALARWRRANLGLVFQDFHLLDGLTALDNVLLPALFGHWRVAPEVRARAHHLLAAVGMDAPHRQAALLSRGERQRVAFARALVLQPRIVMADEPTASLDPEHRTQLGELLVTLTQAQGATLIVISHEQELLSRMNRCLTLHAGHLHEMPTQPLGSPA